MKNKSKVIFKNQFIYVLLLFLFTTSVIAQKYEKAYQQNITYKTGNNNGKDVSLNFACKYDAFMGEPIFSSRTKITSEGDFIVYNGKKYYRDDIGDEIFDKVEIGLINVSFDIYQGSLKITTVRLENEISVSFIPGSPEWDQMWPGVSEERVKQIWKEGYSIRNAKLYDVKFRGFYALESLLKKKEDDEKKRIKAEEKAKKDAEEKAKKELEDIAEKEKAEEEKKKKEESEKKEDEEVEQENKEKAEADYLEEENRRKQEAAERERKRKEEAERVRKEKINAYNDRIESQRKENNAIAASTAASSASILYILGGFIYSKMGLPAKDMYTGSNFHLNFDFGYGFSVFPISYASEKSSVNYDGDVEFTKEDTDASALTIDLRLALKFGYEMQYGGGNIYGRFEPGFSPFLTDFNTSYGYGAEVFGGHKNFKLYGRFEMGTHSFSSNNWLDPEEYGEGGKSSTKYQQIRAGLKFSFYKNARTAKRDHIILGIMENYFNENSATVFSSREKPDKPLLNIIKTLPNALASGYFFEWKRDHTHRLYIEIFPNYPVTGEMGGTSNQGKFFIQAGFSRSIEGFMKKN